MSNHIRLHAIGEIVGQCMSGNPAFELEATLDFVRELVGEPSEGDLAASLRHDLNMALVTRDQYAAELQSRSAAYVEMQESTEALLRQVEGLERSLEESEGYRASLQAQLKEAKAREADLHQALEFHQTAENNRRDLDDRAVGDYEQHIAPLQDQISQLQLELTEIREEKAALIRALEAASKNASHKVKSQKPKREKLTKTRRPRSKSGERIWERAAKSIMAKLEAGRTYTRKEVHKLSEVEIKTSSQIHLMDKLIAETLGERWQGKKVGAEKHYTLLPLPTPKPVVIPEVETPIPTPAPTQPPQPTKTPQTTPPSFAQQYAAIKPHALPIVLEQPNISVAELKARLMEQGLHQALGYKLEADVLTVLHKDLQAKWDAGELKPAAVTPDVQEVIDRMAANRSHPVSRALGAVRSEFNPEYK